MTYFDPEVYNEDNLKPEQQEEIQFYRELFQNAMESATEEYLFKTETGSETLDKIHQELIADFCKRLKEETENRLFDVTVAYLENNENQEENT